MIALLSGSRLGTSQYFSWGLNLLSITSVDIDP